MKYVIQPSDSISSISKKFRVSEENIIKENTDITDPNVLIVGETINIPIDQEKLDSLVRQQVTSTCPTLRIGSRGSAVATLQKLLLNNGFNPGPIDGIFGSRTDAAVRAFQAARGLVVDGIVGIQTWTALGVNCGVTPPPTPGPCPTLRIGSRGSAVATLQKLLLNNGFNPGPIDGIFGSRTDAAVRAFQTAKGLVVDGIVGIQTWTALGVNCHGTVMFTALENEETIMMPSELEEDSGMMSPHYDSSDKMGSHYESSDKMGHHYHDHKMMEPCHENYYMSNYYSPEYDYFMLDEYQSDKGMHHMMGKCPKKHCGKHKHSSSHKHESSSRQLQVQTCPTLRIGSRGAAVATLQQLLINNGFNPGPIDGIFGSRTDAAVRAFQTAKGLVVDGIVGIQTWTALGVNCGVTPPPTIKCPLLRRGSRGRQVAFLQSLLTRAGFPLVIDGIFGSNTQGAVISFQRSKGLPITGVADEATWEALGVNCSEVPPIGCPILRRGSRGRAVIILQELINQVGFGPLAVTGYFGPRTQASVIALQRFAGIPVTGIVDVPTWNALGMNCTM